MVGPESRKGGIGKVRARKRQSEAFATRLHVVQDEHEVLLKTSREYDNGNKMYQFYSQGETPNREVSWGIVLDTDTTHIHDCTCYPTECAIEKASVHIQAGSLFGRH